MSGLCDAYQINESYTDKDGDQVGFDADAAGVPFSALSGPSPINRAEARERLAEFSEIEIERLRTEGKESIPDVVERHEKTAVRGIARLAVEESGSVELRALARLFSDVEAGGLGAREAFELWAEGCQGKSVEVPTREEMFRDAKPAFAREAVRRRVLGKAAGLYGKSKATMSRAANSRPKDGHDVDEFLAIARSNLRGRAADIADFFKPPRKNIPIEK